MLEFGLEQKLPTANVADGWMKRFAVLCVVAVACSFGGVRAAPRLAPDIVVLSCTIGANASARPAMHVTFRNDGPDVSQLSWHARFGTGWIAFDDRGTVASGTIVTRTLFSRVGLVPGYYSNAVADCAPESVPSDVPFFFPTPPPDDSVLPRDGASPSEPIGIIRCQAWFDGGKGRVPGRKLGRGLLGVRFRNLTAKTIDRVVFRAKYLQDGGFDFVAGGIVRPGAISSIEPFRRMLGQLVAGNLIRDLPQATMTYYQVDQSATNCAPVAVRFTDGTTWQNPMVGPTEPPMPTPPPTVGEPPVSSSG